MLIWECSISHWRTKVLCYFHFSRISSDGRGVSVVTIHYLTRFDDSHLSEATIKTDKDEDAKTYITDILWYHLFMKKIAGTSNSKFENLFKLAKVVFSIVHSGLFNFQMQRKNLCSPELGRIWLHRVQVFNLMDHCQASCPSSWTDHMVNHAVNIIHRLALLKRLRLPLGNIARHIHRVLNS